MTLEKQFTLEAAEKPSSANPTFQRRQKFLAAIDKQMASGATVDSDVRAVNFNWAWQSDNGDWYITPRYGKAVLELKPGMKSIRCGNLEEVEPNLARLRSLTTEGKLDKVLASAAQAIRSRFQK